jgi:hypothetical protein
VEKKELEVSIQLNRSLVWPKEPEKRLATQLLLFRSAAEGGKGDVIAGYGWRFIPSQDPSPWRQSCGGILKGSLLPCRRQIVWCLWTTTHLSGMVSDNCDHNIVKSYRVVASASIDADIKEAPTNSRARQMQ